MIYLFAIVLTASTATLLWLIYRAPPREDLDAIPAYVRLEQIRRRTNLINAWYLEQMQAYEHEAAWIFCAQDEKEHDIAASIVWTDDTVGETERRLVAYRRRIDEPA